MASTIDDDTACLLAYEQPPPTETYSEEDEPALNQVTPSLNEVTPSVNAGDQPPVDQGDTAVKATPRAVPPIPIQGRRRRVETDRSCCGSLRHRTFMCISKLMEDCTTFDQRLLLIQLLTMTLCLAATTLVLVSKQAARGHCLIASHYSTEGPSEFIANNVMCDIPMYGSLGGSCLVFTFIMVNWVALLHTNFRWIIVQLVFTAIGLAVAVMSVAFLTFGMYEWCDSMMHAVQCPGPNVDPECKHIKDTIHQGCLPAAEYFDQNEEKNKHPQKFVFAFTVTALGVMGLVLVLWIVLLVLMGVWLHLESIRRRDYERQKAEAEEKKKHQHEEKDRELLEKRRQANKGEGTSKATDTGEETQVLQVAGQGQTTGEGQGDTEAKGQGDTEAKVEGVGQNVEVNVEVHNDDVHSTSVTT